MNLNYLNEYASLSLAQMQTLAIKIGLLLKPKDIITLTGDLGSGKTAFARALITSMGTDAQITSPTFTLMQSYAINLADGKAALLWHLDLYRIKHKSEIYALGLEEIWPHITLIEWAEIVEPSLPPEQHLNIGFDFGDAEDSRTLILRASESWRQRFSIL